MEENRHRGGIVREGLGAEEAEMETGLRVNWHGLRSKTREVFSGSGRLRLALGETRPAPEATACSC